MEYLSTNEIAKKWNVSRKTVNRYAKDGMIEGAIRIGKNWMIPANTKKEDCVIKEEYHFPFYIYRDFFKLKDALKTKEEKELYRAFEVHISDNFEDSYVLFNNIYLNSESIHIKITCLYMMARASIHTHKYNLFTKSIIEMNELFMLDFNHKEEMRILLADIETYYRGFDSLLKFSIDPTKEFSSEALPSVVSTSLYAQILRSIKNKSTIDTSTYEALLKSYDELGYIFPSIMLRAELAVIYHSNNQKEYSYFHIKNAYEIAKEYNGYSYLSLVLNFAPNLVEKGLKYYGLDIDANYKKHMKQSRNDLLSLAIHFKKPKSLFNFSNDDLDYIVFAIKNLSNKEIAALKNISVSTVNNRYLKLYESFSVNTKAELIKEFKTILNNY